MRGYGHFFPLTPDHATDIKTYILSPDTVTRDQAQAAGQEGRLERTKRPLIACAQLQWQGGRAAYQIIPRTALHIVSKGTVLLKTTKLMGEGCQMTGGERQEFAPSSSPRAVADQLEVLRIVCLQEKQAAPPVSARCTRLQL